MECIHYFANILKIYKISTNEIANAVNSLRTSEITNNWNYSVKRYVKRSKVENDWYFDQINLFSYYNFNATARQSFLIFKT